MNGIVWGELESNIDQSSARKITADSSAQKTRAHASSASTRGTAPPALIDLNFYTANPHQNLTMFGAENSDQAGCSVAAADYNGDGVDDFIIGANLADGPSNRTDCGAVYVIFGATSFPANSTMNLATDADITIYGADQYDFAGHAVASGDVNGDNLSDIIISSPMASGFNNSRAGCGEIYIIFGNESPASVIDLNTSNSTLPHQDVTIYGQEEWDNAGWVITSDDVSGDIKADIIISAIQGSGPSTSPRAGCGEVYILKGTTTFNATIDLNTTVGTGPDTIIHGSDSFDQAGSSLATGNIDGSSKADLIIGAPYSSGPDNTRSIECGEVYLIFGNPALSSSIDLNTSSPGTHADVIIYGVEGATFFMGDQAGSEVAVGDIDGDNNQDLIISAPFADGPGNSRLFGGDIYIIYGSSSLPSTIDLNTDGGGRGPDVIIYGAKRGDLAGITLKAGDINNDLKQELLIGAPNADAGPYDNRVQAGAIYIIYGSSTLPTTIDLNTTTEMANHNLTIWGGNSTDSAGFSIATGDVNGDTIDDTIIGAPYADGINENKSESGEIYTLYGSHKPKPNLNPWITITVPSNGMIEVALNASIIVNFSEPMNVDSVEFNCIDDPGGWEEPIWNAFKDEVTFVHTNPFNKNTNYIFEITNAIDLDGFALIKSGAPNPWSFFTEYDLPMIIETAPINNTTMVILDEDVIVKFNKSMDIETVQYSCEPTITGGFTPNWNWNKTEVIYTHSTEFTKETLYTFEIMDGAQDQDGIDLIQGDIPNPWIFTTIGDNPVIKSVYPADDAISVPVDAYIIVEFSKPMATSTVTYSCSPELAGGFITSWNAEGDKVIFSHLAYLNKDTIYTFSITGGEDMGGNELVSGAIPSSWSFKTIGGELVIISASPQNGDTDVKLNQDIIVTFSEQMNIGVVTFSCTPDPNPGGWTIEWDNDKRTVTLGHPTPFENNTHHIFEITGAEGFAGQKLIPGLIPNPWEFETAGNFSGKYPNTNLLEPLDKSTTSTLKPHLNWRGNNSEIYYVYLGTDKAKVANHDSTLLIVTQESTGYQPSTDLAPTTTYYWTVVPSNVTTIGICTSGVWSFTTPEEDETGSALERNWLIFAIITIVIIVALAVVVIRHKRKQLSADQSAEPKPPAAPEPAKRAEKQAPVDSASQASDVGERWKFKPTKILDKPVSPTMEEGTLIEMPSAVIIQETDQETEIPRICDNCNEIIPDDKGACPNCGASIKSK